MDSVIQERREEIVYLFDECRENLNNESESVLAEKRKQINDKIMEAAIYCKENSTALNNYYFHLHAVDFASIGLRFDSSNPQSYDILINIFQTEKDEAVKNREKYLNEETVFRFSFG